MRVLVIVLALFLAPAGSRAGRDGLASLRAGDAEAAATHFRDALEAEADINVRGAAAAGLRAALHYNLGLSLLAQDSAQAAAREFDAAAAWEATDSSRARILYNAGTALAQAEQWTDARTRLVEAVLLSPDHEDARHNLELVLRRLQSSTPPEGDRPPEPSAFARRLKAEADRLVEERRYAEAVALMRDGLARDSTVAAFNDYVGRLEEVVGIVTSDTSAARNR